MKPSLRPLRLLLLPLTLLVSLPSHAEKADRTRPLIYTADKPGVLDVGNSTAELTGDVVITQGSMRLLAEKVRLQETSDGYYQAFADGDADRQVNFHQARDVPGESIEGSADHVEYDTRADTVKFVGNASLRQLRGALVASETNGAVIVYDNRTERLTIDGSDPKSKDKGRARGVFMPRAASGAEVSLPAASAVPLQPSTALTQHKSS